MDINREVCVGCGRCQPYCPIGAISFKERRSTVDQEVCYECGNCLRVEVCPVDAIAESTHVYDYPRAIRKYFSDPNSTHALTGMSGRGTEETKSNDITLRCGPGEVGIAIEVGRPNLGMNLADIQKITRALARNKITGIEEKNPIQSLIENHETGDLKPELLNESLLSAIIEIQLKPEGLRNVLRTLREVAAELDGVFSLDVYTMLDKGLTIPADILEAIEAEGFSWRPNAKINMGLGRKSE